MELSYLVSHNAVLTIIILVLALSEEEREGMIIDIDV